MLKFLCCPTFYPWLFFQRLTICTSLCSFLQLGGNIEQCYETLKDGKWNEDDLHRLPEDFNSLWLADPRNRSVSDVTPRTNTTNSSPHPQLIRQMTYPKQNPPLDLNQPGLQNTWPSTSNWDRTSRPPGGFGAYGGASPTYSSGFPILRSGGSPGSPSMHSFGPPGLPSMHPISPPGLPLGYPGSPPGLHCMQHPTAAPARHHPVSQNPLTGKTGLVMHSDLTLTFISN